MSTASSISASFSSTGSLHKPSYSSYFPEKTERDSEINKMLKQALQELTLNPDNAQNKQQLQTLIPISVLLDEMRSDYSSTRTYCLKNLQSIALVMGPAKAKGLLGGFISNLLKDQDDGVEDVPEEFQVMLTLLSSLPGLLPLIGGSSNGEVILKPLIETLPDRQREESKNSYLKTIKEIFCIMCKTTAGRATAETLLKKNLWLDGNSVEKIAAGQLIAHLTQFVSPNFQIELTKNMMKIIDETKDINVKKKCIMLLPEMVKLSQNNKDIMNPISIFLELQDLVPDNARCYFLTLLPSILNKKSILSKDIQAQVFQTFLSYIQINKTVYQTIFLDIFQDILNMEYFDGVNDPLLQVSLQSYVMNLKNSETEIKNKSSGHIKQVIKFLKINKIQFYDSDINTRIKELINDKSTSSKLIIMDNLVGLIKICIENNQQFSEQECQNFLNLIQEYLIQGDGEFRYKFLLKQSSFDYFFIFIKQCYKNQNEIRENVKKLFTIACSILSQKNWRMKQQCLVFLQKLLNDAVTLIGNNCIVQPTIVEIIETVLQGIQDRIHNVREESSQTLREIFRLLPNHNYILQQLPPILESPNYLVRVQLTLGLKNSFSSQNQLLEQLIEKSSQDRVPNVRLSCIETIFFQLKNKDQTWILIFKPILTKLCNDPDPDVSIAAQNLLLLMKQLQL